MIGSYRGRLTVDPLPTGLVPVEAVTESYESVEKP